MTVGRLGRDAETAAFLDGTARGELLLRRCPEGHWSEPKAHACTTCASPDLSWATSSGDARLVSWAVTHGRPKDDGTPPRHTVVGVVELDEGPWWWTQLVDVESHAVSEGMRLRVAFERASDDDEAVPVFRPAGMS